MFNNLKKKVSPEAGFTLVEAMVALVILTTALGPILYLANSAVNSAYIIRDNMTAAGLAQEGVEVIRAIRDANWLNSRAFDSGLSDGTYRVEWNSTSVMALSGNPALKINNGLYNYSTGTNSQYTRRIFISKVNVGELRVISWISWQLRGGTVKHLIAEDHLFDWK